MSRTAPNRPGDVRPTSAVLAADLDPAGARALAESGLLRVAAATGTREARRHPSYLLAFGFGTSVVMWGIGFACRLPPVWVPSAVLLFLLLGCQLVGGFLASRSTGVGIRAGVGVGVMSAFINLLVLGSLLGDQSALVPAASLWVPGSLVAGALLGGIGGVLGRPRRFGTAAPDVPVLHPPLWTGKFARVAALATLLLLVVGGMVTSKQAGLAVVDWPNSFGYNMFLFPLSKMTGGVYFEHSHRLFGALVGLTTLVLAIHLQFADSRRWVRWLAIVALVMVIGQGILGGLRVTGYFTTSTDPNMTAPSLLLALVHGVFGQVFFATLVALAAVTSPSWQILPDAELRADAGRDHIWTAWAVGLVVPQLVVGALYRHFQGGLAIHLSLAVFVAIAVFVAGIRGFGLHPESPLYTKLGKILVTLISLQILLGFGALTVVTLSRNAPEPPIYDVIVATAHQATGATVLAVSTLMFVWSRRLFRRA